MRPILITHLASTLFMVGMIWTIHYVHYPLFAYVGESTYVAFQSEHVNRIGKLLLFPWLIEGVTLLAVLILACSSRFDREFQAFGENTIQRRRSDNPAQNQTRLELDDTARLRFQRQTTE